MTDDMLCQKLSELRQLMKAEGASRTEKIKQFILQNKDPEFEELAMTLILLWEAKLLDA